MLAAFDQKSCQHKPPIVTPWYPYPMPPSSYPFLYYMPWMPQPRMPFCQGRKESPRLVPSHSSNSSQDRFPQKNRSNRSKVKNVKKVRVRKKTKAPEIVAIKEESQYVQVTTGDAVKVSQSTKAKDEAMTVDNTGPTRPPGRSKSQQDHSACYWSNRLPRPV